MIKATLYHSGEVLLLAKNACERSVETPTEAEASIILAAAAVEGFLNDIADVAKLDEDSPSILAMRQLLRSAEQNNVQPTLKLLIIHFGLTGRPFDNGSPIAKDFKALFDLRNRLAHLKPDTFNWDQDSEIDGGDYPPAVNHLIDTGVIDPPSSQPNAWRNLVADPAVARWACNVVVNTTRAIAAWSSEGRKFADLMDLMTVDLQPISEHERDGMEVAG